jgi:lipid A ethanolaminephosphotransferase
VVVRELLVNALVHRPYTREAFDLATVSGAIWISITGLLPLTAIVLAKIEYGSVFREIRFRTAVLLLCCLGIGVTGFFFYKNYASFGRTNSQVRKLISPTNYIGGTIRYFQKQAMANRPFEVIDPNARLEACDVPNPTVFIMIVGETARAMNFSLNG